MLTIGELSRVSNVTVKSIRYYQELGILEPVKTDPVTNYRYYDDSSYERLNGVITLKELGFTLSEISKIFNECSTENELRKFIELKINEVRERVKKLKDMEARLKGFNSSIEAEPENLEQSIQEVELNLPLFAKVKIEGGYSSAGIGFKKIYSRAGRWVKGAPYAFYYDMEYKRDPDFYACIELNRAVKSSGVETASLLNKKAVKMIYKGPYGSQGEVYFKLFNYCREKGYKVELPIIEHYIKGPGFIFKGNPKNYITECILLYSL